MYYGDISLVLIYFVAMFIIAIIFSIFSPLGIGFIICAIIGMKTQTDIFRKIALISQIVFLSLTFIIGSLICLFILVSGNMFTYSSLTSISLLVGIFFGVCFVVIIGIGILYFEYSSIKKRQEQSTINSRRR